MKTIQTSVRLAMPFSMVVALLLLGAAREARAGLLTILGTFDFSTVDAADISVDPSGQLVYVGSGFGGSGLIRVDVSNPASMSSTVLSGGGAGVAVNIANGRYATTNGFGSTLSVFNRDTTLFSSHSITGIGGGIAAGSLNNWGINTQGNDTFQIYNEGTNSIVFSTPNAVGAGVFFNSATGNFYADRGQGGAVMVNQSTFATTNLSLGISGVNGMANRIYSATSSGVVVRDGNNNNTLLTIPLTGISGVIGADTLLDYIYVPVNGNQIDGFDGTNDAYNSLGTFNLPGGYTYTNMSIAPGSDRLYVVGQQSGLPDRLFVLQPVPEPGGIILAALGSGVLLIAVCRPRQKERLNGIG